MHGLMGDRLLKRFLKGIRRKSAIASANETEPMPERGAEKPDRSNGPAKDQLRRKEEEEQIKKTNDQKDVLDTPSGVIQSLDDLEKTG